ncbi:HipA domain-containing protein [Shewanella sp. H8]|uniref:type II toxin-antitoxin system HipA family toxin n=1 Tax=Shewanella sp. H8 TaxID=3342676 RepID=UPI0033162D08
MKVDVFLESQGQSYHVGELQQDESRGKRSVSFQFKDEWLANSSFFQFDPTLPKSRGYHYPALGKRLFGAIGDSAPDTWGRKLLDRRELKAAEQEGRHRRALSEVDYLLGVADLPRLGSLRFSFDGYYQAPINKTIPTMVSLGKLMEAAERVERGEDTEDDLFILFAPGSSLGGARPKASVTDSNDTLYIAKFPKDSDGYSVERWEAIAMDMANDAGLDVCEYQLTDVAGKKVYLTKRFDRTDGALHGERIPFISAMALTDHDDGDDDCSYLELVDVLSETGANPSVDIKQLFKRIAFSILISNVDDHFRNHGFLWNSGRGWQLSPLYDVNPVYNSSGSLRTCIDYENSTASLTLLVEVAGYFGISDVEAKEVIKKIAKVTLQWRDYANKRGAPSREIELMTRAFEHDEMQTALSY